MKPLRDLTHKEQAWCWLDIHEKAWKDGKNLVATTSVLADYKPSESLEIQCDSSQAGLGVALMQNADCVCQPNTIEDRNKICSNRERNIGHRIRC